MRNLPLRLLFLASIGLLVATAHAVPPEPDRLAAYIAEPLVWTSHWNEPCDGCSDQPDLRQVRFRLLDTLRGPQRSGELGVTLTSEVDHDATDTKHALLIGRWRADGTFDPVAAHQVDALRGGGWALCERYLYLGNMQRDERPRPQPLDFAGAFGDASRLNARGRLEQFEPPDFAIVGNDVHCQRGVRAEEVVKLYAGEPLEARMTPADTEAERDAEAAARGVVEPEEDSEEARHRARRRARDEAARATTGFKVVMANTGGDVLWAFVGEKVSFHDTEAQCGAGCWQFDGVYAARYRPRQVFDNADLGPSPVPFSVWTHNGYPGFAQTPTALLFVWARHEGLQLAKYQAMSVNRTTDGRWAVCGDPYRDDNAPPAGVPRTVSLRFADDVVFDDVSRWSAQRIAEKYPADR
jgi:hypothetical protein